MKLDIKLEMGRRGEEDGGMSIPGRGLPPVGASGQGLWQGRLAAPAELLAL